MVIIFPVMIICQYQHSFVVSVPFWELLFLNASQGRRLRFKKENIHIAMFMFDISCVQFTLNDYIILCSIHTK